MSIFFAASLARSRQIHNQFIIVQSKKQGRSTPQLLLDATGEHKTQKTVTHKDGLIGTAVSPAALFKPHPRKSPEAGLHA
jgi:hypothetical protein